MPADIVQKRHAGYVEWNPQDKTMQVIEQVGTILDQYKAYWPLTIRQIFYRLVAEYNYSKTEQAYGRLMNYLGRARRANMIPFKAIRDDGAIRRGIGGYVSVQDWADHAVRNAEDFNYVRMDFQPVRVEIFCEAAGMVPLLANAVADYGVDVYSGGGFNSLTTVKRTADRIMSDGRKCVVLNFGDLDPSGESIFESFRQDVEAFCWQLSGSCQVDFQRVALTDEQVAENGYETAPPKSSDSRSKNWVGETAQLEAVPPDELSQMAVDSVVEVIDLEIHEKVKKREDAIAKKLAKETDNMIVGMQKYINAVDNKANKDRKDVR